MAMEMFEIKFKFRGQRSNFSKSKVYIEKEHKSKGRCNSQKIFPDDFMRDLTTKNTKHVAASWHM